MSALASALEQLTSFATGADATAELVRAKEEFFSETGEIFDNDRAFEARSAAFLDHFLFARPQGNPPRTPAELFLAKKGEALSDEERAAALGLTRTLHGLYEVVHLDRGNVDVRDVLHDDLLRVTERRHIAGLVKGDLVEARLIPVGDAYIFAAGFLCHPREARTVILREVRRRRARGEPLGRAFVWELSRMEIKVERYRNIPLSAIYRFDKPSFPAHAPAAK